MRGVETTAPLFHLGRNGCILLRTNTHRRGFSVASKQENVDFVLGQMAAAGRVRAQKMFGEYGIYCNDKIVALFCDDQLYVKPTDAGQMHIGTPTMAPAYPGAKPSFLIAGDLWEERDWLAELIRKTAAALPAAKKKATGRAEAVRPTRNATGATKTKGASKHASVAKRTPKRSAGKKRVLPSTRARRPR